MPPHFFQKSGIRKGFINLEYDSMGAVKARTEFWNL